MKPSIKYAVIFGVMGFFISLFTTWVAFGFVWLFVAGDNPSPVQELIGNIITFGVFIIAWFFTIYLGYRLGKDKEKS